MDLLSSGIIIFFLPAALILYYGAGHFNNRTAQKMILCTVSLLFYLFFGYIPFIIMFADAIADRHHTSTPRSPAMSSVSNTVR